MKAYLEIDLEIDYDASPAEAQTLNYPGCDGEIRLTSAMLEGMEVIHLLTEDEIEHLEEQALEFETERQNPDNEE